MHKALLVARYEYRRFARRRAFLLGTIGFPLLLVVIAGVGVLVGLSAEGETIGYVDRAGVLAPAVLEEEYAEGLQTEDLQAFGAEEEGREALRTGRIDVLFVLPETYLEDRSAIVYLPAGSEQALGDETRRTFATFIEASLAYQYQPAGAPLLMDGPAVTVRVGDRERTAGPEAIVGLFLPFVAGILFLIAAVSSAGYLLQAVSDEKENRTAEILTTSVSPAQLIIGKAVGLVGVAGTQLAVWATGGVVAYVIAAQFVPVLAEVEVPWVLLGTVFIFFVPAYLLLAGIMVSIGSAFPEYQDAVRRKSFCVMTLLFPLLILGLSLGNTYLADMGTDSLADTLGGGEQAAVGYVDQADFIKLPPNVPSELLRPFATEAEARGALETGEIGSFYLIPPEFLQSTEVTLVQEELQPLSFGGTGPLFEYVLSYSLLGETRLAAAFSEPLSRGEVQGDAVGGGEETSLTVGAELVPFAMLFILFFILVSSSSYLLQSVPREKENRTAEVLLLSVTPRGLMAGKVAGLGAVALTQMAIWIGGALVALWQFGGIPDLASLGISWVLFVWLVAYLLLGFVAYGSILAALGALVPSQREGAQLMFAVLLPLMIPLWFNYILTSHPNGIPAVALSLFPLTAPVAMVMRLAAVDVPIWQPLLGLAGLGLTAYLFLLVGARIFRADTLLSADTFSRRRLVEALRGRRV